MFDFLIPFLVVITVLVFIHELGHYLIARFNGVRVETFSVGFGPELFGRTDKHGTRWRVSALPLGGYVKMLGGEQQANATKDELPSPEMIAHLNEIGVSLDEYAREAFPNKRIGQRAAIVAGGPVANFLLSAVLFAGLFMFIGEPTTEPIAGTVQENSAAAEAGMVPNDRILAVDGDEISTFEELRRIIGLNRGTPIELLIARDGQQITLVATPKLQEITLPNGDETSMALLGITQAVAPSETLDPLSAVARGVEETYDLSVMTVQAIGQIIGGSRGTEDVGGVIRIAEMSGQVADVSIVSLIHFMAILSISLGLINLVPIPVLDGGHLLFYAIEAVRGRPLSRKAVEVAMGLGLVVVVGLFVTTTVLDLMRFDGVVDFFNDLAG